MLFERESLYIDAKGHVIVGGCDTVVLAKEYGTPLYIMDEADIRTRCRQIVGALKALPMPAKAYYASKAQMNMAISRIVTQEGMFLDTVSGGEMHTALKAGVPAENLAFHGNCKTPAEVRMAIENNVGQIILDAFEDLHLCAEIAKELGKRPKVLIRLRPGIDAHTHNAIKTATLDSKFGFSLYDGAAQAAAKEILNNYPQLELIGVHCHIGSQIFETQPYDMAADYACGFVAEIGKETGHWMKVVNLGGGFGVRYTQEDDPIPVSVMVQSVGESLIKAAREHGLPTTPTLEIEPGRSIVGEAGLTLYSVGANKNVPGVRHYIALDGSMADSPRVALYGAKYTCMLANRANDPVEGVYTLAGRCCESGDILARDVEMPEPKVGDTVVVFTTGAYHASMASQYNRLAFPASVLVKDGKARLISKRPSYEDLVQYDVIPDDLKG